MKSFLVLSLCLYTSMFAMAQSNNIERDLNALSKDVGGAGNGGGQIALEVGRAVNNMALQNGVANIPGFASSYRILVGDYNFCDNLASVCDIAARFYPLHKALLVDKKTWVTLSNEEKLVKLEVIVGEIDRAR
ncbi:MAG: hypothetical protein ACOYL6_15275 [Bacteriovoracaceae bacterium]